MRRAVLIIAAALFGALAANAADCPGTGPGAVMQPVGANRFAARIVTLPRKINVGAPFEVEIEVCATDGIGVDRLSIDATMPAHRHGMNYKPEITPLGPGRYRATGFLFHMPGQWEFALSLTSAGTTSVLRLPVHVP